MPTDPFAAFRAAVEGRDVDAAVRLFSDDCVLSPIVHEPYRGDGGHVLAFDTRVGDRALQGVDVLRGRDGVLTELTVMVRPYSAATALRERKAAPLA